MHCFSIQPISFDLRRKFTEKLRKTHSICEFWKIWKCDKTDSAFPFVRFFFRKILWKWYLISLSLSLSPSLDFIYFLPIFLLPLFLSWFVFDSFSKYYRFSCSCCCYNFLGLENSLISIYCCYWCWCYLLFPGLYYFSILSKCSLSLF